MQVLLAPDDVRPSVDDDVVDASNDEALLRDLDSSNEQVCRAQRRFFTLLVEADRRGLWEGDGAHDMAHWL